jgi:hypothetical protein
MAAALSSGPRLVGIVYPRDVWWMLAFMRLFNIAHALRRSAARYFIHRQAAIDRLMAEARFVNSYAGGTRGWRVLVYHRA